METFEPKLESQAQPQVATLEQLKMPEASSNIKPEIKTIGYYRSILNKDLSPEVFKPNPYRLIGYFAYAATSIICFFAILKFNLPWYLKTLLGLLIGYCNGAIAFLVHEVSHGSVVKNKTLQDILFFFGALTFMISPTFWRFWHNKMHHGMTQKLITDPDAFPSFRIYKSSKFIKFMFPFTPGSGHKRSYFYYIFWFSFHNLVAQTYLRFRNDVFKTLNQKRVTIEFALQVALVVSIAGYAGIHNFLWVVLLPMFAQNYLLMSYISTNHNLSPLTSENDPLVNSVTVTNHSILEFLSLNFGYHVEHHIFPTVNGAHIKAVHRELLKKFSKEFICMPKWKAIRALYSSPRIYKNSNELIHPETLKVTKIRDLRDQPVSSE